MTDSEIAAAEALAAKATPGPWRADRPGEKAHLVLIHEEPEGDRLGLTVAETYGDSNAAFIAAARTLVPALCAEVRARYTEEEVREAAEEYAEEVTEWRSYDHHHTPTPDLPAILARVLAARKP